MINYHCFHTLYEVVSKVWVVYLIINFHLIYFASFQNKVESRKNNKTNKSKKKKKERK